MYAYDIDKTYYLSDLDKSLDLESLVRPHALQLRDWFYHWIHDRSDTKSWAAIGRNIDSQLDGLWQSHVYASDENQAADTLRRMTSDRYECTEAFLRTVINADSHLKQFHNNSEVLFRSSETWAASVGDVRAAFWQYACMTWISALQGVNSGQPAAIIAPQFKPAVRRQARTADPVGETRQNRSAHQQPTLHVVHSVRDHDVPDHRRSRVAGVAPTAAKGLGVGQNWRHQVFAIWFVVKLWISAIDVRAILRSGTHTVRRIWRRAVKLFKRSGPNPAHPIQTVQVDKSPEPPPVQTTDNSDLVSAPAKPLNGNALKTSAFGTWIGLVVLSWVSLIWGALISLPFGIGIGIIAMLGVGIIAVPLWGTVFGLLGMQGARGSTFRSMKYADIDENDPFYKANTAFAAQLDIPPPKIGTVEVYNAFAMGSHWNNATVALGKPLLKDLTENEARAVLGHELGHVVSGDMRRMMLMRTFQNACVWYMCVQELKQFARWVIGWVAELFILAFSRKREFWADAIGAALTSKEAMIGALQKLEGGPKLTTHENLNARFMFRGRAKSLLSTHPTTKDRIAALERETYLKRLPFK